MPECDRATFLRIRGKRQVLKINGKRNKRERGRDRKVKGKVAWLSDNAFHPINEVNLR